MRRRDLIKGIAGSTIAWPLAARAQQPERMPRVGILMGGSNDPLGQGRAAALVQGLGEFNWHDGDNLRIDWRWAGGNPALYERYAAELIALDPEVLVVWGSPGVGALRRQTSTIPIVLVNVTDPVGQGFADSLAHPGGNITGFTDYDPPMAGKWLRMLTQIIPPVARVAVLFNPTTAPFAGPMLRVIEESAPSLAVAVRAAPCHDDAEIEAMMTGLAREEGAGLLVLPENFVIAGGLISYGASVPDAYRQGGVYTGEILKGAKPADLPVVQPTKFGLVINLKTAMTLGLTVPPAILARADEVIE